MRVLYSSVHGMNFPKQFIIHLQRLVIVFGHVPLLLNNERQNDPEIFVVS